MSSQDLNAFSALIRSLSEESSGLYGSSTSNLAASLPSASAPLAPFLSLKSALLLSYTQHLVMLSSHRLLGLSLVEDEQGSELVRNLVRMRVLLEKSKTVEAKLRPRWEREIRAFQTEQNKIAQGIKGASDDEDDEDDEIGEFGQSALDFWMNCHGSCDLTFASLSPATQIPWPSDPILLRYWMIRRHKRPLQAARSRRKPPMTTNPPLQAPLPSIVLQS